MTTRTYAFLIWAALLTLLLSAKPLTPGDVPESNTVRKVTKRYLYVATPGIRNYLEYGGHGLLVYDIDNQHRLVKRIPTAGLGKDGKPLNVKGIAVSLATQCVYVSTINTLQCIDLVTEKLRWEKEYEGGCDRMAMSPDGKTLYVPSFEKDHWHVVDAATGNVIRKIVTNSGAHNTLYGLDGSKAYLAGLRSPYMTVVDTRTGATRQVGPFNASIRPFTINGRQTLLFVNINELLGFEVADLTTGKKLHRVEISGFKPGPVKRHGCPSHGIGLTPDEKELWVVDAFNQHIHRFDATVMPPKQLESIPVRDQPGWITFSLDGRYAYPSTGEVIDVKTRKTLAALQDEQGSPVQSEKMVEIHFDGTKPVQAGDQFGVGRVTTAIR
jgi:DNA-binding beta-propeller fold protein YncE